MSSKHFTMATIRLFSAFKQTHYAVIKICDSECAALHRTFSISTKVVAALFCFYMAGAVFNCCCLGASSVYTKQPRTS